MSKGKHIDWEHWTPIIWCKHQGRARFTDRRAAELIGCSIGAVCNQRWRQNIAPKSGSRSHLQQGRVFSTFSRRCGKCGSIHPLSADFWPRSKRGPNGFSYYCKGCWSKHRRRELRRMKARVFAAYGGARCACCGETQPECLVIDHINGDGAEHRNQLFGENATYRAGTRFYYQLRKQGYPAGFQVLCLNCNWMKYWNGEVCPHTLNAEAQHDET